MLVFYVVNGIYVYITFLFPWLNAKYVRTLRGTRQMQAMFKDLLPSNLLPNNLLPELPRTKGHLVRFRNHAMDTLVQFMQKVNGHQTWHLDPQMTRQPLQYDIYESPFNFHCTMSSLTQWKFFLLPEWFTFGNGTADDDNKKRYTAKIDEDGFILCKRDCYDLCYPMPEADSEPKYLEVRLCGKDESLFKNQYPFGIDITDFGNIVFNAWPECIVDTYVVRLYEIFPFILHHATKDTVATRVPCYERDSMYVSLLDNDTFDVINVEWDSKI